jgi:hypothetical protein
MRLALSCTSFFAVSLIALSGCVQEVESNEDEALGTARQEAVTGYHQTIVGNNGLSANGLSANGLSANGLSANGLSANGLDATEFGAWFAANRAQRAQLMEYVVHCAVPNGQSRSYTDRDTLVTYTWEGSLGLAPGWAAGNAATAKEKQVVTACLAAHANKFGYHVDISVLGKDAVGDEIPYTSQELATYSVREACFFGNLFDDEGVFVANDGIALRPEESSPRVCGIAVDGSTQCSPIEHVGGCADLCTLDSTGTYYVDCVLDDVHYAPITTRIRPENIYSCGDGTCQNTEKCGEGETPGRCNSDCGLCPG